MPLWKAWEGVHDAVGKKQEQVIDDRRLIAEGEDIRRSYAISFSSRASKEKEQDRHEGEMTALLREIELLARQSGIRIRDIKPQSAFNRSVKTQAVFISAESTWDGLAQFIYAVQRSSQLLRIQKGDFHRNGEEENHLTGQFIISR